MKKSNAVSFTADEVSAQGGMGQALITRFAERAYSDILNKSFPATMKKIRTRMVFNLPTKLATHPPG